MPAEPLVALVALNDDQTPEPARLVEALREIRPEAEAGPVESREGAWVFRLDGDLAAVSRMPGAIDWSELAEACARAWYWPEAAEALRGHATHVLVAMQPEAADRVRAAMGLTAVAAAVAQTARAAGVYWSASALVHSPEAFITYARQMTCDSLPLLLWIDFEIHAEDDGSHSIYTTGMREFNQMEIEVRGSHRNPQSLLGRVYDVVHYLLKTGAVLQQGETIGTTEEERIPITIGPSTLDPNTQVVQLGL